MEESGYRPPPRRRPNWLVVGGLALAFAFALGLGAFLGPSLLHTAQAASNSPGNASAPYVAIYPAVGTPGARPGGPGGPGGPGAQGQCVTLTVTSVSGQTVTAKAADGTTVTVHTTASTTYSHAGASATASVVTVGAQIHVMGTHNSDGSITATQIDVG